MKKSLLLGFMTLFLGSIGAQENVIDTYFKAHLENPAFTKFEVTEKSFELLTEIETEDAEELKVLEALANIKGIKVLANKTTEIGEEYYFEAMDKLIPDEAYEDLMIFEHPANNARFLIRENESAIQEFVAVIGVDKSFIIASLYGEIDLKSISKILGVMRSGGGEWFSIFENLHDDEINIGKTNTPISASNQLTNVEFNQLKLSIFPNPATDYINITTESSAATTVNIGFYSLLGKEIQDKGEVALPYKVDLKDLPVGTYFLRLTDEQGTFKNFKIVKSKNR